VQVRRVLRDLEAVLAFPDLLELLELQVGAVSVDHQADLAALVLQVSLDRRDSTDNPDRLDLKVRRICLQHTVALEVALEVLQCHHCRFNGRFQVNPDSPTVSKH